MRKQNYQIFMESVEGYEQRFGNNERFILSLELFQLFSEKNIMRTVERKMEKLGNIVDF